MKRQAIALIFLFTLSLFTIVEAANTPTSIDLYWNAPATFTNGAALNPATDLTGYKIECGLTATGPYTAAVKEVSGGSTLTTTLTGLTPNTTYYCVGIAHGVYADSSNSNEVSRKTDILIPGVIQLRTTP